VGGYALRAQERPCVFPMHHGFDFARCYIDDIIVHGQSFKDHLIHLRRTFGQIREKGVKLHPKKMKLAMPSVSYLGHEIVPNGTTTDEAKLRRSNLCRRRKMTPSCGPS
jgi:hypothetical protein